MNLIEKQNLLGEEFFAKKQAYIAPIVELFAPQKKTSLLVSLSLESALGDYEDSNEEVFYVSE